jgi:hypothetical protein
VSLCLCLWASCSLRLMCVSSLFEQSIKHIYTQKTHQHNTHVLFLFLLFMCIFHSHIHPPPLVLYGNVCELNISLLSLFVWVDGCAHKEKEKIAKIQLCCVWLWLCAHASLCSHTSLSLFFHATIPRHTYLCCKCCVQHVYLLGFSPRVILVVVVCVFQLCLITVVFGVSCVCAYVIPLPCFFFPLPLLLIKHTHTVYACLSAFRASELDAVEGSYSTFSW